MARNYFKLVTKREEKKNLALPQVQNPVVYPQDTLDSEWNSPMPGFKVMCSRRLVFRKETARSQVEIYRHFGKNVSPLLQDRRLCGARGYLQNPVMFCQTTRRHISKDGTLHCYCHKKLKSRECCVQFFPIANLTIKQYDFSALQNFIKSGWIFLAYNHNRHVGKFAERED